MPLNEWLKDNNFSQDQCGLTNLDHFRNVYLLFHQTQLQKGRLNGINSSPNANDIQLSIVTKTIANIAVMHFNKDNYSVYCREYKEYREWEDKRNDSRYQATLSHGKNYDAKNMMHTFRLLNMAEEIALFGRIIVGVMIVDFCLKFVMVNLNSTN